MISDPIRSDHHFFWLYLKFLVGNNYKFITLKNCTQEREIIAASEKLAECQETILNLGKQLKALASPTNASVPDKIICNPIYEAPPPPPSPPPPVTAATNHHRISLLDKMMAEDAAKAIETTKTKSSFVGVNGINGIKHQEDEDALVNFLSIVPSKKKKSGVLRKLLWRRKKSNKWNDFFVLLVDIFGIWFEYYYTTRM